MIVATEDEGKSDHPAFGFAEVGKLGHAADVHAGAGAELHRLDYLARLAKPAVGENLDVERRRLAVHVVREDPRKHLMLGAGDVVGAGVVDADDFLLLRQCGGHAECDDCAERQADDCKQQAGPKDQ